ncbi:hypothetical protein PR048_029038 [Dryococelus australis]|uniref:Uncharacterized protein n=1 Tax=Dryococelus australis TaxID=614101 RepID=A0ABQ9GEV6_9NEOP|nr:hypothetical protein PR048_029038 [Dryococelus australis]
MCEGGEGQKGWLTPSRRPQKLVGAVMCQAGPGPMEREATPTGPVRPGLLPHSSLLGLIMNLLVPCWFRPLNAPACVRTKNSDLRIDIYVSSEMPKSLSCIDLRCGSPNFVFCAHILILTCPSLVPLPKLTWLTLGRGYEKPLRKLADHRHRPARFPCGNPGETPPGIEAGSPRWEESSLTTTPPLNCTVLYVLKPASFLHWLLLRCEDIPSLTELHVTGAHNCEVFLYWCRVTQDVAHKEAVTHPPARPFDLTDGRIEKNLPCDWLEITLVGDHPPAWRFYLRLRLTRVGAIKAILAAKPEAVNWRAVFSSCCVYLWGFKWLPYYIIVMRDNGEAEARLAAALLIKTDWIPRAQFDLESGRPPTWYARFAPGKGIAYPPPTPVSQPARALIDLRSRGTAALITFEGGGYVRMGCAHVPRNPPAATLSTGLRSAHGMCRWTRGDVKLPECERDKERERERERILSQQTVAFSLDKITPYHYGLLTIFSAGIELEIFSGPWHRAKWSIVCGNQCEMNIDLTSPHPDHIRLAADEDAPAEVKGRTKRRWLCRRKGPVRDTH